MRDVTNKVSAAAAARGNSTAMLPVTINIVLDILSYASWRFYNGEAPAPVGKVS